MYICDYHLNFSFRFEDRFVLFWFFFIVYIYYNRYCMTIDTIYSICLNLKLVCHVSKI